MTRWAVAAALFAAATILAEIVVPYPNPTSWWHAMPGFDLAFGLLGCAAIVVVSKALGTWLVQRPESYAPEQDARGAPR